MKSTIFTFLLMLASFGVSAQNSKLDEIFTKFQGKDGITSVNITADLLRFASEIDQNDPSMHVLKKIKQVRILSFENAQPQDVVLFENMIKDVPLSNFKELMVIRENRNNVRMLALEDQGKWSDFLLIVTGGTENVLINIQGTISPAELKTLSSTMKVDGMAYVGKLK